MLSKTLTYLVGLLCFSQPLVGGTITIDFETFPGNTPIADGISITKQFSGLTFTNTTVITAGISLNEFELPPHSGQNVAFDDGGPISISFATPVLSFSGYFTYYEPLTVNAFDAGNNLVESAVSAFSINVACDPGPVCLGDPGSSPNKFLSVAFAGGISSLTIMGDLAGGSFVMDDITYTELNTLATPEPGLFPLFLCLIASLLAAKHTSTMTNKRFIIGGTAGISLLILAASVLWAQSRPVRNAASPDGRPMPLQTAVRRSPLSTSSAPPQLGTVALDPPSIVVGSSQPITVTLQNTDQRLIRTSVNILELPTSGAPLVIGQMNDNGANGDLTANDATYTATLNLSAFPVGAVTLRVSAAFSGFLNRVQSSDLVVTIFAPTSTTASSSWVTLTDQQKLFSLRVPAAWGLNMLGQESTDGGDYEFQFPNGALAFQITIFTPADWTTLQNSGFSSPQKIGATVNYVFGWSEPADEISVPGFTDAQVRAEFDDIIASFRTSQ